MKLSRNVNNKKHASKMICFNEKVFRKIRSIFDVDLNVRILQFLTTFTQLTERLKMGCTLLFYKIESLKNGPSLILPSSIARNSSAPNAKRIFQILWGVLEGRTNSAWPSGPCLKNCQNGTFWSVHGIWKFFGPNDFIWDAMKVLFSDFIQKNVSGFVQLCPLRG